MAEGTAARRGTAPDLEAVIAAIRALREAEAVLPAERALAERLGIKRHLLRRALAELRQRGDLPRPPARGRRGTEGPTRSLGLARNSNPVEVMELRAMIEPALARLAAVRATPNQIAALQRMAEEIGGQGGGRARADLHRLIAEASGNGLAREVFGLLRDVDKAVRVTARMADLRPSADTEEHRAIVAAIARRDPDAAEAAMRAHLRSIHRLLTDLFG